MDEILNNNLIKYTAKKNIDIKKNKRKHILEEYSKKINLIIFQISLISLLVSFFLSVYTTKKIQIKNLLLDYEIILTINDTGEQNIFSQNFSELPSQIYINNVEQNVINHTYNLNNESNEIKMIWNTNPESLSKLF